MLAKVAASADTIYIYIPSVVAVVILYCGCAPPFLSVVMTRVSFTNADECPFLSFRFRAVDGKEKKDKKKKGLF